MTRTYTEQANLIATRQTMVAKADGTDANARGVKFTASGRYFIDGVRVGYDAAVQHIAARLEAEAAPAAATRVQGEPRRTGFTWDKLNQATQDFFFNISDQMQTVSQDHGMIVPVAVKELRIGLVHAPRLSNLKKAGLIEGLTGLKKSHKMLRLTDEGRAIWMAHNG
jgi:hypothetical protein